VANLSKTLRINCYHNRSSIVEVMKKNFFTFLCHTVYIDFVYWLYRTNNEVTARCCSQDVSEHDWCILCWRAKI